MKKTVLFLLLFAGTWLLAQASQSGAQHPPKTQEEQVAVQGCVSRSSGHYILMQSSGTSYVIEETGKINVGRYLGQQVKITGIESRTFNTSATALRSGAASPPITITVKSINTISKQCAE